MREAGAPLPEVAGVARLLSETPVAVLDLHGYTSEQARLRVRDFLTTHSRVSRGGVVHIVTGKGTGSEGTAVLRELVRKLLEGELSGLVAESAGLPGGGGWVVRLD
jgi:DNA-nicking Smr family endonuclease